MVDGIANTVSGARPLQNLTDLFGYEHDRLPAEFAGPLRETAFVAAKAREYGLSDVEVLSYDGGPEWDGTRSLLQIRDAVNAEYAIEVGPVTLEAVEAYLRQLADAGVLTME